MEEELKCKACGELASEDSCFYSKQMLCNRHYLQMRRHGKIISVDLVRNTINNDNKICSVCGDAEHKRYYTWCGEGKYRNKIVCAKHYNQLITKGYIDDVTQSEHKKQTAWTSDEIKHTR